MEEELFRNEILKIVRKKCLHFYATSVQRMNIWVASFSQIQTPIIGVFVVYSLGMDFIFEVQQHFLIFSLVMTVSLSLLRSRCSLSCGFSLPSLPLLHFRRHFEQHISAISFSRTYTRVQPA